jgi:hypothetical protein
MTMKAARIVPILVLACLLGPRELAAGWLPVGDRTQLAGASSLLSGGVGVVDLARIAHVSWVEAPGELGRRTVEQYALDHQTTKNEVLDRYAATGVIECKGYKGSAQLTGDNSTISTAAHVFSNPETCKKNVASVSSCTFSVTTSLSKQTVNISRMVGQGFKCPAIPKWIGDDWAVLKLTAPIDGVKPYRLPAANDRLKEGDKVISVNAYNNDVFTTDRKTRERRFPKTIEECTSKIGHYDPVELLSVETTCDQGHGASGGSLLKAGSDVLMAVHKGNDDTKRNVTAGENGRSVRKPYIESEWASYHVLVAGEFLATLKRAVDHAE